MRLVIAVIVLAIVAAIADHFVGIKEPWRKIIYFGLVALLVVALVLLLFPGLLPVF